jgi:hypothetical protein
MNGKLSLSLFTLETDRRPILTFAAKRQHEAEAFCADEGSDPNSDRSLQAASLSAATTQSCGSGWPIPAKERATKNNFDLQSETWLQYFWSM